jgi:hypothetical protein
MGTQITLETLRLFPLHASDERVLRQAKEYHVRRPIKTDKLIPFLNPTLLLATNISHEAMRFFDAEILIHGAPETAVACNVTIVGHEEKVWQVRERLTYGIMGVEELAVYNFLQQLARECISSHTL